jgi:transcriptional regulator with XRE-family HTH domain
MEDRDDDTEQMNHRNNNKTKRQSLQELARKRIAAWVQGASMPQGRLAVAIGKNQVWVSRYLTGKADADVDTLQRLAAAFGHTIASLLQTAAGDADEAALIEAFRALRPSARATALAVLREMAGRRSARGRPRR